MGKEVEITGYSFTAPDTWQSSKPSSNMRVAQFDAPGEEKMAEVVFYHFGPGGAGGVKANVDRWMKQFEQAEGESVKTLIIGETEVTYAQAYGTFLSGTPFGPKTPKPGFAMLAAIVQGKEGAIFIKMTGPKDAVDSNSAALKTMVEDCLRK